MGFEGVEQWTRHRFLEPEWCARCLKHFPNAKVTGIVCTHSVMTYLGDRPNATDCTPAK
jgi:hypothetical protein